MNPPPGVVGVPDEASAYWVDYRGLPGFLPMYFPDPSWKVAAELHLTRYCVVAVPLSAFQRCLVLKEGALWAVVVVAEEWIDPCVRDPTPCNLVFQVVGAFVSVAAVVAAVAAATTTTVALTAAAAAAAAAASASVSVPSEVHSRYSLARPLWTSNPLAQTIRFL